MLVFLSNKQDNIFGVVPAPVLIAAEKEQQLPNPVRKEQNLMRAVSTEKGPQAYAEECSSMWCSKTRQATELTLIYGEIAASQRGSSEKDPPPRSLVVNQETSRYSHGVHAQVTGHTLSRLSL